MALVWFAAAAAVIIFGFERELGQKHLKFTLAVIDFWLA